MGSPFDAGAPLDNSSFNVILDEIADLRRGDISLTAKIGSDIALASATITNAVAKKMVAGKSIIHTIKLTYGTARDIEVPYSAPLTGTCAAFLYSLQMDTKEKVDLSSALVKFSKDTAIVSVQKVTPGTDTYSIYVHYLAIAAN